MSERITSAKPYSIALAEPRDVERLPAIELAAARLLEGYTPAHVLATTTPLESLEAARVAGRLWVARVDDEPVGFAHVMILEPTSAHLEELDVHPDHGRRGIGRKLVTTVCEWAAESGFRSVTLSTFRSPPWNMPFYASLGFRAIPNASMPPTLARLVEREVELGMDPATRVAMEWIARRGDL